MTPSPNTRSRTRSVLLIVYLIGLILTSIFLSRRRAYNIQETSSSIYKDRLLPTNMLVNLTSTVYRKRLLLETYVLAIPTPDVTVTGAALDRLNRRTDSLLTEFGKTSLTVREADQLRLLKQQLVVYNRLEGELATHLVDQQPAQQALFAGSGSEAFGQIAQTLDELATLQVQVGEELLAESREETNYIYVLTALQIGLVLLIGLSLFWYRF
jgi:hypothetical protein